MCSQLPIPRYPISTEFEFIYFISSNRCYGDLPRLSSLLPINLGPPTTTYITNVMSTGTYILGVNLIT